METNDISVIFSPLSKNNLQKKQQWKEYFSCCTEKREYYDNPSNKYNNVFRTFYLRNYKGNLTVKTSVIHFEYNNSSTSNGVGYKHNKVCDTFNTTAPVTAMQNYLEIWSDFAVSMWKLVKCRAQWQYGVKMSVWATVDFRTGGSTLRMADECSRWWAFLVPIDDKLWS